MLTIRSALYYPTDCPFPWDKHRSLTRAWVICMAIAIIVQLHPIKTESHLQKNGKDAMTSNNPPSKQQGSDESKGQSHYYNHC